MSLTNLLKMHGVKSPRIVTAVGGVVVGSSATGLTIPSHTFHGGDEGLDVAPSGHWWEADGAMDSEREDMKTYFPGFEEISGPDGVPMWRGRIDTGRGTFEVTVVHRLDHGLPRVVPAKKSLGRSRRGVFVPPPHVYTSKNLCVADESDWNPARDNASAVVAWACHWFACYVDWFIGMPWPSEGVKADAA
jgi:hypothetical protein